MIEGVLEKENNYDAAEKLLDVAILKHKATASNSANIETPECKRFQVASAFESQLNAQIAKGTYPDLQTSREIVDLITFSHVYEANLAIVRNSRQFAQQT